MAALLILSLFSLSLAALNPKNVLYAVNCGGQALKTKDGISYVADTGYSSGISSDYGFNYASIKNTKTPEVYQTERYDTKSFTYKVPVPGDGRYTLVLKFSEVYFGMEGDKVFDVRIGDVDVINALDIFAKVGKAAAYDEHVELDVKEGEVWVAGQKVRGGMAGEKLVVEFVKGSQDNPKVNAILLVRGTKADTDFYEQKTKLETITKQKEVFIEERAAVYDDTEDYESVEVVVEPTRDDGSLLELVFSGPGVALLGILFLSFVLLLRGGDKAKKS